MSQEQKESPLARIVSLCKRRGFVFPASEIYGGLNGFWDFGPLGVQLKNNLRDAWWHSMVECPPLGLDGKPLSIVGLDSSIIQHPQTWVASGHVAGFNDLMVDCRETKQRYRADHVMCIEVKFEKAGQIKSLGLLSALSGDEAADIIARKAKKMVAKAGGGDVLPFDIQQAVAYTALPPNQLERVIGPDAETAGTFTEPRVFNMMFESYAGTQKTEENKVYLRPETAQGIFLNFNNVQNSSRVKMPFGIAQVGKAFRNEVTPRNFIFRSREFEQMEMEFFCPPEQGMQWYEFWVNERLRWWEEQGVEKSKLYRHDIPKEELAHYSAATADIEYLYPFTAPNFGELEGVAYRQDFDLGQHQKFSGQKLEYMDQENSRSYIPHVIEPASGLTRGVLVLLCEAYRYDESRASPEWLKLKPSLAPIKAGIFPLVNKDGMPEIAEKLFMDLRKTMTCQMDAKQSIGKRYARMDEAGTPFCVTIDGETLTNQTVTIRHRDTAQQEKVALSQVQSYLQKHLET